MSLKHNFKDKFNQNNKRLFEFSDFEKNPEKYRKNCVNTPVLKSKKTILNFGQKY